jgi:ribonuclease P/MRP protein subunit POP1
MASRKAAAFKSRAKEETCKIPASVLSVPLPRNLDLASFVDARMTELNHFLDILADKAKGRMSTKRNFQLLPKHMRRRAMSHNAHRVPSRVRTANQEIAYLKNPCRKSRRHYVKMMQEYTKRSLKAMWLETHIWHAKRMKMMEKWGYKIGFKCNDKSVRATYRFSRDSAVIYDQSYLVFLVIQDVDRFFRCFDLKAVENFRSVQRLVHVKLIANVEVYFKDSLLVVSIHPAAFEEFSQVLNELQIPYQSFKDQVTVFKLRGPRSTEYLSKSLNFKNDEIANLMRQVAKFQNFHFKNGSMICVDVIKSLHFSKNNSHDDLKNSGDMIPEQPSIDLLLQVQNHNGKFYDSAFWDFLDPDLNVESRVPEKITTRSARSRYPASRKTKQKSSDTTGDTKMNKNGNPLVLPENNLKISEIPENDVEMADVNNEKFAEITQNDVEMEEITENLLDVKKINENLLKSGRVLLVYHRSKHGSGWDLILKSGFNNDIWRSLVYSGCKAVGLQEFKSISFESGDLFFPNDFPSSQSYDHYSNEKAKDLILNYFKKPSAKRINFERIKSPFPFYSCWKLGNDISRDFKQLVPVKVKCFNRCPKDLSYICKAEESDIILTKFKEPLGDRTEKNSNWKPEHFLNLSKIKTSRQIIGFITTGGFSYRKRRGFGIGHITSESSTALPFKALFRNPSSQFYHLCLLKQLKSNS